MNEEQYIRDKIEALEQRLSDLLKNERTFPLLIANVRREIENERRRLERLKRKKS